MRGLFNSFAKPAICREIKLSFIIKLGKFKIPHRRKVQLIIWFFLEGSDVLTKWLIRYL